MLIERRANNTKQCENISKLLSVVKMDKSLKIMKKLLLLCHLLE